VKKLSIATCVLLLLVSLNMSHIKKAKNINHNKILGGDVNILKKLRTLYIIVINEDPIEVIEKIPIPKSTQVSRGTTKNIQGFRVIKVLNNFKITHYGLDPRDVGSNSKGIGASGRKVIAYKSVAVDRSIIALDTYIYIEGYGILRCDDTGNFKNRQVDLFTGLSHNENLELGTIRGVTIQVLEKIDK